MTTTAIALRENNIDAYMRQIKEHPLLDPVEEQRLARAHRDDGDLAAAHKLVVSNLRFVVKIAHEYRHYGLKMLDLVQEGNVGLMIAVKKFDPDRGYRLISYAVWWIRAQIQTFIQRSWSLVKVGMSSARRKLFFKVRSERAKVEQDGAPDNAIAQTIAERLGVTEAQVNEMEIVMAGRDFSLDAELGDSGGGATHLDMLQSEAESQETTFANREEVQLLHATLDEVKKTSNDKERYIIDHRLLGDDPESLQQIGDHFGVSRERIRQLESRVLTKLKTSLVDATAH